MIKFTGPEDRIIRATDRVTEKVTDQVTDEVSERENELLRLLYEDPGYRYQTRIQKVTDQVTEVTDRLSE